MDYFGGQAVSRRTVMKMTHNGVRSYCRTGLRFVMNLQKNIQEAMKVTNKAVMEALDGLPPVKVHCSLLAEEAIHAALWDYAEKNGIKIEGLEKPKTDIHEDEEEEEY